MITLALVFTMAVSGCAAGVVVTLMTLNWQSRQQAEAKEAEVEVEPVQLAPPADERADRLNRFRLDDHEWPATGLDDFTEIRPLMLSRPPGDAVRAAVGGAAGWMRE